nr:MAG TPA: hypothetical protein [Caudoviricetes sp.]
MIWNRRYYCKRYYLNSPLKNCWRLSLMKKKFYISQSLLLFLLRKSAEKLRRFLHCLLMLDISEAFFLLIFTSCGNFDIDLCCVSFLGFA